MSASACTASSCPTILCRSALSKWQDAELRFPVSSTFAWPHCVAVAITSPSVSSSRNRLDTTFISISRTGSFSRDPLANVCRAILDLDAVRFADLEKPDSLSIHEGQVFQVQDDAATLRFRSKQCFHLGYIFCVHSTTQRKDNFAVCRSGDLQHRSSFGTRFSTLKGNCSSNGNLMKMDYLIS